MASQFTSGWGDCFCPIYLHFVLHSLMPHQDPAWGLQMRRRPDKCRLLGRVLPGRAAPDCPSRLLVIVTDGAAPADAAPRDRRSTAKGPGSRAWA